MSITLTDHQWAGVKTAADWYKESKDALHSKPCVFTGYAGSGKSTCVGAMIEHIGLGPESVMYMAPTGKAAKVLSRKLRESGWSADATTIHKAIYMPRGDRADAIDREIEALHKHVLFTKSNGEDGKKHWDPKYTMMDLKDLDREISDLTADLGEVMGSEGPKFTLKSPDDILGETKLFVVDEASMVGTTLAEDLAYFGKPILAIGDPGQLPPVGDDWGFDMTNPDVFLSEIHRQAADNPIIHLATLAREGEVLKVGDYGNGVRVLNRRDDDVTYNMDRDAMVLVGTHRKRWAVTKRIRQELGMHEGEGPCKDEPLLVCRNSSRVPALVNGTFLTSTQDHGELKSGRARFQLAAKDEELGMNHSLWVTQGLFEEHRFKKRNGHTAPDREAFRANKECEHVDWGHAITVHKSQGSEFDDVALHDESPAFRNASHRWLYTGITRASDKLTVLV